MTANRKAARSNAVAEAYGTLARAFELLGRLPATPEHLGTFTAGCSATTSSSSSSSSGTRSTTSDCSGRCRSRRRSSPELEGMVLNRLAHMEWAFCDLPSARSNTARAAGIWAHEDRPQELAYAWMVSGWVQLVAGEFDEIARTEGLALDALERGFNLRWHVWTLSFASLGVFLDGALHRRCRARRAGPVGRGGVRRR